MNEWIIEVVFVVFLQQETSLNQSLVEVWENGIHVLCSSLRGRNISSFKFVNDIISLLFKVAIQTRKRELDI